MLYFLDVVRRLHFQRYFPLVQNLSLLPQKNSLLSFQGIWDFAGFFERGKSLYYYICSISIFPYASVPVQKVNISL